MGRVADPKVASLWRKRVERQRRSGVSVAEYCRREGFSTGSFYTWRRRLGTAREKVGKNTAGRGRQPTSAGRAPRGGFVQVPLAVEPLFDVRFADGTVLSVPVAYLAATLETLRVSQSEGAADD
jgi:hypothetical protein